MTDEELARTDALLTAAREVAGCSDHNCLLRVYPRGGMGTNGGCHCVERTRTDEGLTVQAERLDLVRLLALARQTPALAEEVRRLRAEVERLQGEVVEARERLREERATADAQTDQRDELLRTLVACRAEVERLRP